MRNSDISDILASAIEAFVEKAKSEFSEDEIEDIRRILEQARSWLEWHIKSTLIEQQLRVDDKIKEIKQQLREIDDKIKELEDKERRSKATPENRLKLYKLRQRSLELLEELSKRRSELEQTIEIKFNEAVKPLALEAICRYLVSYSTFRLRALKLAPLEPKVAEVVSKIRKEIEKLRKEVRELEEIRKYRRLEPEEAYRYEETKRKIKTLKNQMWDMLPEYKKLRDFYKKLRRFARGLMTCYDEWDPPAPITILARKLGIPYKKLKYNMRRGFDTTEIKDIEYHLEERIYRCETCSYFLRDFRAQKDCDGFCNLRKIYVSKNAICKSFEPQLG